MGVREAVEPLPGAPRQPGFALEVGTVAAGRVLRRVHEVSAELSGVESTPSLVVDYWLERPDGAGLVQLAFATPMLPLRQPLLEFFDAIAGALHWVSAAEADEPGAVDGSVVGAVRLLGVCRDFGAPG